MKQLSLRRIFLNPGYTIGRLTIDGVYFCDTLEDTVRDYNKDGDLDDEGEFKVYGETAIPYGKYEVVVTYSPKFKRDLPLLLNVWGFTGIRIHRGNTVKDSSGCILVGENKAKGKVLNSKFWELELTKRLKQFKDQGETIMLNVI